MSDDSHLRYLLSAYLFGDISEAGKAEVEEHLAQCATCREELDDLRGTLGLFEDYLGGAAEEKQDYHFESRRMERVLTASRNRRGFPYQRVSLAAAAMLLIAVMLPMLFDSRRSMAPAKRLAGTASEAPRFKSSTMDSRGESEEESPETLAFYGIPRDRKSDTRGRGHETFANPEALSLIHI